jgi:hypothetical protein
MHIISHSSSHVVKHDAYLPHTATRNIWKERLASQEYQPQPHRITSHYIASPRLASAFAISRPKALLAYHGKTQLTVVGPYPYISTVYLLRGKATSSDALEPLFA